MTDTAIQKVLDRLNSGSCENIIIRPISRQVSWGLLWEDEDIHQRRGYEYFFVRVGRIFVAAVFWMGQEEMHWYVDSCYRGRRVLAAPLRKTILPFIFSRHQIEKQQCNIATGNFAVPSAKLARKVGFRCVCVKDDKRKFALHRRNVGKFSNQPNYRASKSDLLALELEARRALRSVRVVFDRLRIQHARQFDAGAFIEQRQGMEDMLTDKLDFIEQKLWRFKK